MVEGCVPSASPVPGGHRRSWVSVQRTVASHACLRVPIRLVVILTLVLSDS